MFGLNRRGQENSERTSYMVRENSQPQRATHCFELDRGKIRLEEILTLSFEPHPPGPPHRPISHWNHCPALDCQNCPPPPYQEAVAMGSCSPMINGENQHRNDPL